MTSVSVIIATRDRPADLARCLPTVLASAWADFEVIVVDQSLTEETERVIEALGDPRLRYMRDHQRGKSLALNRALALASGKALVFTDDDCTVPPGWIGHTVEVLAQEPEAGIVFGSLLPSEPDSADTFTPAFNPPRYRRITGRLHRTHFLGVGGNMAIRRSLLARIGGFAEELGPGGRFYTGEDCEIAYRALSAGAAVIQDPGSIVTHWGKRHYSSGAVRRLVSEAYYAVGVGYGAHSRRGDIAAASLVIGETALLLFEVAVRAARRERTIGLRRLTNFIAGAAAGLRHGVTYSAYAEPQDSRSDPALADHR